MPETRESLLPSVSRGRPARPMCCVAALLFLSCLLAVTTAERAARWPAVPSVAELGFPTLVASNWFGLSGPAGMPADIADRVNAALVAGLNTPETVDRLAILGAAPNRMSAAEYGAMVAAEVARWAEIARAADIRAE